MKITKVTDEHKLIHSATLLSRGELDFQLSIHITNPCKVIIEKNSVILRYDDTRFAEIEMSNILNYEVYINNTESHIGIIFENSMRTRLINIIDTYKPLR